MKKLLLLLPLIILLSGCTDYSDSDLDSLSNEAIISETKKCNDAGLPALKLINYNGTIWKIQCNPDKNSIYNYECKFN